MSVSGKYPWRVEYVVNDVNAPGGKVEATTEFEAASHEVNDLLMGFLKGYPFGGTVKVESYIGGRWFRHSGWETKATHEMRTPEQRHLERLHEAAPKLLEALRDLEQWIRSLSEESDPQALNGLERLRKGFIPQFEKAQEVLNELMVNKDG